MRPDTRTILGLDLGTSSVGWALLSADQNLTPNGLIDMGVRHFEEVVEPKSGKLKNAARREARGMRRNLRRRRQRRNAVLAVLREVGLADTRQDPFALDDRDPYALRAEALERKLTPDEIGRVVFHLAVRRGFKSNRGAKLARLRDDPEIDALLREADDADAKGVKTKRTEDEEGAILKEIAGLREQLGNRTLGQFLHERHQAGGRLRGLHTDRAMYEEEFDAIWQCQAAYHPRLLTEEVRARLFEAIFFQRPLRAQKFLKGPCSLEPEKIRADRAQLVAQRFRYWQDIANLEVTDGKTGEKRRLSPPERFRLAEELESTTDLSWESVRKTLNLPKGTQYNLQESKPKGLKGNDTAARVKRRAPELWDSLDEPGRERLIEILLTVDDRGRLYRTLRETYTVSPKVAYDLAILELQSGTASLSSRAMRRILAGMVDGLSRQEAQERAGYQPWNEEIAPQASLENPPASASITNPRVRKALGQVRKVVNAILATYGRPAVIRIELARDLRLTAKEKEGWNDAQRKLQRENAEADEWLGNLGIANPTRTQRFWYRLAKQCKWQCPYTGTAIPSHPDSMSRFQIEHIVPYSRSLDDSFNNLTLCESHANARKGNRTPFEAFGATPEWEHMVARVAGWQGPGVRHKRRLFTQEVPADEEKMLERQLNETRAICREAAAYLRPVCDDVQATKGAATAMLRSHWGLMATLYGDSAKRRDDLRHHAVDAVAIAFTSRSLFQSITRERKRATQSGSLDLKVTPLSDETVPPCPSWLFTAVRDRLRSVVVSHEPRRSLQGAFHEETALGLRNPMRGEYHVRKPLASMTFGELGAIVDDGLRRAALAAYEAKGRDSAKAFAEGLEYPGGKANRARIVKQVRKGGLLPVPASAPEKFFVLGNNHHVAIYENRTSGKRKGLFASTLAAAHRVRRQGRPIVDPNALGHEWRFVGWLCTDDLVRVEDDEREFFRVQKLDASNEVITLRVATAATVLDNSDRLIKTPNTLRFAKLQVDALGRVSTIAEGAV